MTPQEILAILGACLAVFWTIVQIVAHARGQDLKNIKIALAIFTVFALVIGVGYYFGYPGKIILKREPVKAAQTHKMPQPVETVITPRETEPPVDAMLHFKVSLLLDISKNMLGGIDDVGLKGSFANLCSEDLQIVSYVISVAWFEKDMPYAYELERVFSERIALPASSSIEYRFVPDKEIGDTLLKARHHKGEAHIVWTAFGASGNSAETTSKLNL